MNPSNNPGVPALRKDTPVPPLKKLRRVTGKASPDAIKRPRKVAATPSSSGLYWSFSEKLWYHLPEYGMTSHTMAGVLATPEAAQDEEYPTLVSRMFAVLFRKGYLLRTSPSPMARGHHRYTYFRKPGADVPYLKNKALDRYLEKPKAAPAQEIPTQDLGDITVIIGGKSYSPVEARKVFDSLNIVFGK